MGVMKPTCAGEPAVRSTEGSSARRRFSMNAWRSALAIVLSEGELGRVSHHVLQTDRGVERGRPVVEGDADEIAREESLLWWDGGSSGLEAQEFALRPVDRESQVGCHASVVPVRALADEGPPAASARLVEDVGAWRSEEDEQPRLHQSVDATDFLERSWDGELDERLASARSDVGEYAETGEAKPYLRGRD